ncbi:shikimate kinase [Gleimia coleocanis DSM 15436]|uniref:Shikimate kinase n=1 Tax=Gleimia coleocanis DSM 15436 TaxID=525245 RepID=C0W1M2_9ACTO|nr:shikimate kinase [Gleimia coleocanis]EEH63388.1 shikimate kinase [Gleimia coleocanis DSM 15436]
MTLAEESITKPVFLVGMPASGKTTLGLQVALRLRKHGKPCVFIDLDQVIEDMAGSTVVELFAESEAVFRQIEQQALQQVVESTLDFSVPVVIACGGGVVECEANRQILRGQCCIYLDCAVPVLAKRAVQQGGRPLLSGIVGVAGNSQRMEAEMASILQRRRSYYEEVSEAVLEVGVDSLEKDVINLLELISIMSKGRL